MNTTPSWDDRLFLSVNHVARETGWLHRPAELFASYGVVLFGLLLLASWWRARAEGPGVVTRAVWAPVVTLVAVALNQPLVHLVAERRPFVVHPHALLLVSHSADPGFPSDHATMAGAVAMGVLLTRPRWGAGALLLAVLLCVDRVYVGVHYPLDVVAGLVFGGAVAAVLLLPLARLTTPLVDRLAGTRLRPLVATDA